MTALPLLMMIVLAAAGIGRRLLQRAGCEPAPRLDRFVASAALGLGCIGYTLFALGMAGLLRLPIVLAVLGVLTGACWRGLAAALRDLRPPFPRPAPLTVAAAAVLAAFGALAALACHVPPGAHEWDVLAYHLAAVKVYLQHGRIVFLPTDHHSNFPFLQQMHFMLALMLQGSELAALTHFATAALTTGAIVAIGRRHFTPAAGAIGAVVFASSPIVLWEAGIAYIDVAQALYITLAIGTVLEHRSRQDARLLPLAGVFMGLALAVKTLTVIPSALVVLLLIAERVPARRIAAFVAAAAVVGCPFYVKTWALTGNPVYPFAYRVFGGRYWNQQMADTYATEQRSFGPNRAPVGPRQDLETAQLPWEPPTLMDRARNLVMNPFQLVSVPRIYHNWNDIGFSSQIGFLFLALPPLLALTGRASRAARWCAALCALWFAAWTLSMQYTRYLIPMLPAMALIAGEGVCRAARASAVLRTMAGCAIALQIALTAAPVLPGVAAQAAVATSPEARDAYLTRQVNSYAPMRWIDANTPRDAGVILFEETRGYYLDRPYLWGNSPHSLYIPYATFRHGQAMADWFVRHGYRYGLINLRFTGLPITAQDMADLRLAAASGTAPELALRWYNPAAGSGERWRSLLGEALASGGAVILPEGSFRDVVTLEFRTRR